MVYTSASLSLAAFEFFVHLDPSDGPNDLVWVKADLSGQLSMERIDEDRLPLDWRKVDNNELQKLGSDWAKSKRSVALMVPSAVLDEEWNVLLNPRHPNFSAIAVAPAKPFRYDDRMFRRISEIIT